MQQKIGCIWTLIQIGAFHAWPSQSSFCSIGLTPFPHVKKSASRSAPTLVAALHRDGETSRRQTTRRKKGGKRTRTAKTVNSMEKPQQTEDDATNKKDPSVSLCLRYSHLFHRHIVYRPRRGRLSFNWNGTTSNLFCSPDDDCDEVVASFRFLDDALKTFSNLKMVKLPEACFQVDALEIHRSIVAGGGVLESTAYRGGVLDTSNEAFNKIHNVSLQQVSREQTQKAYETLLFLSSLACSNCGQRVPPSSRNINEEFRNNIPVGDQEQIAAMLADRVGKRRFLIHTQDSIKRNYDRIMDLMTRGDKSTSLLPSNGLTMDKATARCVIAGFPQLCLYDYDDVEERVQFFLAPQPPPEELLPENSKRRNSRKKSDTINIDWPRLANMGYGAGFTVQQATDAIRVVPQLLSMHHDDALKQSISLLYQSIALPFEVFEEARAELDVHLTGATASDVSAMCLLRGLLLSWEQISIVLDAFPNIICCDTEPNLELSDHGPVRSKLREPTLNYLRKRLQLRPSEIFAMIKTHTRLSGYTETKIKRTLDALEARVGFSSSELRKVLLRMPSLIGMSVNSANTGLNQRLVFFYDEVGLSPPDLRKAVLKQPSLLQYSVEQSLRPKLHFLREELMVPSTLVPKVVVTSPSIMGLSLEENLRPKTQAIMNGFGLDRKDMGEMVSRVPQVLTSSWKRNLEPAVYFLSHHLSLSQSKRRELVKKSPWTLIHSAENSLLPKLKMIQAALDYEEEFQVAQSRFKKHATSVVVENPSLLVTTRSILQRRLETYIRAGTSVADALLPPTVKVSTDEDSLAAAARQRKPRKKRGVRLVSEDNETVILEEFPDVQSAAAACEEADVPVPKSMCIGPDAKDSTTCTVVKSRLGQRVPSVTGLVGDIHESSYQVKRVNTSSCIEFLETFVSGRAYPPDNIDRVRGIRRTGGVSIYFPQLYYGGSKFSTRLRLASRSSFGQIMPGKDGGSNFTDGIILVGFPYLRPSRNRCGLYACHDALKVVLQLLKQASSEDSLEHDEFHIFVSTDSEYAWKLLCNETRVLEWGSYTTMDDFQDKVAPLPRANPDLLYPLARTYHRLVTGDVTDECGNRLVLGKRIEISFRHSSSTLLELGFDQRQRSLERFAERAAIWQYGR